MNGEINTYNVHRRINWREFKRLPDDVAKLHIEYLRSTYGANLHGIAEALGVSYSALHKHLEAKGIKIPYRRFEETPEWREFLGKEPDGQSEEITGASVITEENEVPESTPNVQFDCGELYIKGKKGVVLEHLFRALPEDVSLHVRFFALEGEK